MPTAQDDHLGRVAGLFADGTAIACQTMFSMRLRTMGDLQERAERFLVEHRITDLDDDLEGYIHTAVTFLAAVTHGRLEGLTFLLRQDDPSKHGSVLIIRRDS